MTTAEVLEQLRKMSNAERLVVIETATRLVRQELQTETGPRPEDDPILRVAGCLTGEPLSAEDIERELYDVEQPS